MKARLFFVALIVLCLGTSLLAQTTPNLLPFKFGRLKPGDTLVIRMFKEPYLVTGTEHMRLGVRVVVRDDGKLDLPFNVPLLNNVIAGGLTVPELQQVLEGRYSENNYDTRVTV